jgi:hypothetical protein
MNNMKISIYELYGLKPGVAVVQDHPDLPNPRMDPGDLQALAKVEDVPALKVEPARPAPAPPIVRDKPRSSLECLEVVLSEIACALDADSVGEKHRHCAEAQRYALLLRPMLEAAEKPAGPKRKAA